MRHRERALTWKCGRPRPLFWQMRRAGLCPDAKGVYPIVDELQADSILRNWLSIILWHAGTHFKVEDWLRPHKTTVFLCLSPLELRTQLKNCPDIAERSPMFDSMRRSPTIWNIKSMWNVLSRTIVEGTGQRIQNLNLETTSQMGAISSGNITTITLFLPTVFLTAKICPPNLPAKFQRKNHFPNELMSWTRDQKTDSVSSLARWLLQLKRACSKYHQLLVTRQHNPTSQHVCHTRQESCQAQG